MEGHIEKEVDVPFYSQVDIRGTQMGKSRLYYWHSTQDSLTVHFLFLLLQLNCSLNLLNQRKMATNILFNCMSFALYRISIIELNYFLFHKHTASTAIYNKQPQTANIFCILSS